MGESDMVFSTNGVAVDPNIKAGSQVQVSFQGSELKTIRPMGGAAGM